MSKIERIDYEFFYEGLAQRKLLIQRCDSCGRLRNPPVPRCFDCGSMSWSANQMCGRGTVFSYTIHHYPPLPGFVVPHPMGVVDLDEGVRFFAAFDSIHPDEIAIGLRVKAEFLSRHGVAGIRFVIDPDDVLTRAEETA